ESFEDDGVAALLNEAFVCVKVDREERPDVDHVYMKACQMITGSGGWPLSILMTYEAKPFFAATYVPKEDRYGRAGLLSLIPRIRELWREKQREIQESAERIARTLAAESAAPAGGTIDRAALDRAYEILVRHYDGEHGGFGTAPKFPTPHNLLFLLRYWKRTGERTALSMVETTLRNMRGGGVFDHIGFGFHRYSTDAEWRLPHFEKMLYDQALLTLAYLEGFQATGDPEYRTTAEEILGYVLRDMTAPSGAFYSAEDADSDGQEGGFYVWSMEELANVLDAGEIAIARAIFDLGEDGNVREEAAGRRSGFNLFHMKRETLSGAGGGHAPDHELRERWEPVRKKLYDRRESRAHPAKDDKILTDWNGLMIAAFARAARTCGAPVYADAARRSAAFILENMRCENGGLFHRFRDGDADIPATVDDYAFFIWGLVELYEATFQVEYLETALDIQKRFFADFWDESDGGFFFTSRNGERLIIRDKALYDGAIPSGNSVAMLAMLRLGRMTADAETERSADRMADLYSQFVEQNPAACAFFLASLDYLLGPAYEVVVLGGNDEAGARAMIEALNEWYHPSMVVLFKRDNESIRLENIAPFTKELSIVDGKATAYVCRNRSCGLPVTSADDMLRLLR
ncbi:MAG: thioredoxin domain-containing protein, partial [Chitinivibrionia bacterium]|nr:thioredoxin domain-containing protein [Chitinivibrionia bacterium]